MDGEGLELEIIINPKAMSDGQAVIQVLFSPRNPFDTLPILYFQLETAAGAAIKHFKGATCATT